MIIEDPALMKTWTITLPLVPVTYASNKPVWSAASLNIYERLHWRPKSQLHKWWRENIRVEVYRHKIPMLEHVELHVTIYFKTLRTRDTDNYTALYKLLNDALKKRKDFKGIIPDDSPEHVTFHPVEMKLDRRHPRIVITITD